MRSRKKFKDFFQPCKPDTLKVVVNSDRQVIMSFNASCLLNISAFTLVSSTETDVRHICLGYYIKVT